MPRRNIFPRLKGELENRIHQLSPGDMLPGENALAAEFGVSRPTLRRALAELEKEGVVGRRNGVGTVVRSVPGAIRRELPFVCGSIDFFSAAMEHFCRRAVELNYFPMVIPLAGNAVAQERLMAYHRLLLEWNARMDLTNVPEEEMALRHYADSLLPLARKEWFPDGARLIDVGTGAGFPGMPLAIARPDLKVTLLDSQRKRCDFLSAVCDELKLPNVTVLHARAEDGARGALREQMDVAVARAVAPLNVLAEYLLPYVRVGGRMLCWKGPAVREEMAAGERACKMLGGQAEGLYRLPIEGREHYVHSAIKISATARRYPRKSGTPSKDPLGILPQKP